MLAVADHLDGEGPQPPDLQMYLLIKQFGDPYGGGWMNWPAGTMERMRLVRNVYEAYRGWLNASNKAAWTAANPVSWEIVSDIISMRGGL